MKWRTICGLIAMGMLTGVPALAGSEKDPFLETIASIKRSVVPVVCAYTDDKGELQIAQSVGSGFFVNKRGHFVTAGHVVRLLKELSTRRQPCYGIVYVPTRDWADEGRNRFFDTKWFRVESCSGDEVLDLAVCACSWNPFEESAVKTHIAPIRFGSFMKHRDGTPVAFTGFPLSLIRPLTARAFIASYRAAAKQIVVDNAAWPGASGSPLYVANGQVIGVIVEGGVNEGSGLAYACPIDFVLDLLRKSGVDIE